jgi:hypothetical protein
MSPNDADGPIEQAAPAAPSLEQLLVVQLPALHVFLRHRTGGELAARPMRTSSGPTSSSRRRARSSTAFETQWTTIFLPQAPCGAFPGLVLSDRVVLQIGG